MPSRGVRARPFGRDQRRHTSRVVLLSPVVVLLGRRDIRRGSGAHVGDGLRVGKLSWSRQGRLGENFKCWQPFEHGCQSNGITWSGIWHKMLMRLRAVADLIVRSVTVCRRCCHRAADRASRSDAR